MIKTVLFRILCLGFSIYALSIGSAVAQGQAGTDFAVLNAGVGARALGMGGAFSAIADNADAPYWNPAGLGSINDNQITAMQIRLSTDANHYYVSYVQPAFGGTLGISWIQVGLGNITQTSSEVDVRNEVRGLGSFSYFSNAYMLSFGKQINNSVSLGLTAKYLTSDMMQISSGQAWGYSITPGALFILNKSGKGSEARLGIKVDDILNQQSWRTGTVEKVPPKLTLSFAVSFPNPGLFAVDIRKILKSGYEADIAAGYEWKQDGLSLRAGYASGALTAGAGFESGHARVDYAYVTQSSLSRDNVHRVSVTSMW